MHVYVSLSAHWTANSVADIHSPVRPSESFPHDEAARPWRHFPAPGSKPAGRKSDDVRTCANIRRGRNRRFLGGKWTVRRKDLSRVRNQVLDVRVICMSLLVPVMTRARALKRILVPRNASSLIMLTTWKISAISAARVASCREASVASRANLVSIPSSR